MAFLKVSTPDGLQHVPLLQDRLRIGRLASNDIILPYSQISREHAELQRSADSWWISDLDSTNGLQVSGRRVSRYPLQPGQPVQLAPDVVVWLIIEDDTFSALATTQMPVPGHSDNGVYPSSGEQVISEHAGQPLRLHLTLPSLPPGTPATHGQVAPEPDPGQLSAASRTTSDGPWTPVAQATTWQGNLPPADSPHRRTVRQRGIATSPTLDALPEGDLFRRSRSRAESRRRPAGSRGGEHGSTIGQAPLYLCQTCGQRTPPDALTCQFCHTPIARPCNRCQLSILPNQERCPRCQTPNPAYSIST